VGAHTRIFTTHVPSVVSFQRSRLYLGTSLKVLCIPRVLPKDSRNLPNCQDRTQSCVEKGRARAFRQVSTYSFCDVPSALPCAFTNNTTLLTCFDKPFTPERITAASASCERPLVSPPPPPLVRTGLP
jgi:hypothetical protein